MKTFSKIPYIVLALAFTFALTMPKAVFAATSPDLGTLSTFGIVSETSTNANTAPYTIVNGSVCGTTLTAPRPLTITGGAEEIPCLALKGADQSDALADLNAQAALPGCTNIGPTPSLNAVDIDGAGGLAPGTFSPGCYKSDTSMTIATGTTVTLQGAGTYIFKSGGALTTGSDSQIVLADDASACDVFWVPVGGTTIGAYTGALPNPTYSFVGNIFRGDAPGLSITLGHFSTLLGRALAYGSTVTTDANEITVPTCTTPPVSSRSGSGQGTINVVKAVINDNGGTKKISDFSLFVNDTPVTSGVSNFFPAPGDVYYVNETPDSNYTRSFSGDCDAKGGIGLNQGNTHFCILTNNDIGAPVVVPPVPPLIDVVKVPNPLALPNGPGTVDYTYTISNNGTEPMTDVTMVGDSCSPISLISGDTNNDSKLDTSETWTYTCSTRLEETHTNTVVATGWANGISAVDIASATVVVGEPNVPPLIHVTKVPSPLVLPAGGGTVTYTEKLTNPGIVPLEIIHISDDKCAPLTFVSGDTNNDSKLDTSETWTYTCQTYLSENTTNTVSVSGEANGHRVRDLAIAHVIVATAVPLLPNTGSAPAGNWYLYLLAGFLILGAISILVVLKKRKV